MSIQHIFKMIVTVFLLLVIFPIGEASLCQECSCTDFGVVNCRGAGLLFLPDITTEEKSSLGDNSVISLKDNKRMAIDREMMDIYVSTFSFIEVDSSSDACVLYSNVVVGCEKSVVMTTTGLAENDREEKSLVEQGEEEDGEGSVVIGFVVSLKKNWMINTILQWVGYVGGGIFTSCFLRRILINQLEIWFIRRDRNQNLINRQQRRANIRRNNQPREIEGCV